ncbi:glycosyltransferase [Candidatus Bipolaricaulota bacterium]|nr:glycosyltransferase [Candidatus Bipolaricaulota bacterium]
MEHPDFGGQLVYVKETALRLAELGHRVDIITRQIKDPEWPEFSERIDGYPESDEVRIVRITCGPDEFLPKEELWPHLGTGWLEGIINFYRNEGESPEVMTTHYGDGGLVGALYKQKTGTNYTFTGHSLGAQKMDRLGASEENISELDEKFNFSRRLIAERVAMNRADRVITSTNQERLNQYSHQAYRGAINVEDDEKFSEIPPGVNREIFNEEKGEEDKLVKDRVKSALGRDIPPDRRELPLVICSSRLDRKKNHIGLVKAFAESRELRESANLAIVARGADNPLRERNRYEGESKEILDEIASHIEQNDIWDTATSFPLENQRELAAAYRWASERRSVFALTALYEPFGLAPLEAMSCGLPAVVTNQGGPTESMKDEETGERYGVLVDPEDPDEIADGLLELLTSEEAWEEFQQGGLDRVLSRYTWEKTAKSYSEILTEIRKETGDQEDKVPVPDYYTNPSPENDISLARLEELYFSHGANQRH